MEQRPLYGVPLGRTAHRCSVYLYCELSDGTAAAVQCSFRGNSTASALSIYIVCIQMEQQLLYSNPFIGITQHLLCAFRGNSTAAALSRACGRTAQQLFSLSALGVFMDCNFSLYCTGLLRYVYLFRKS
jgi:hypothetical protein